MDNVQADALPKRPQSYLTGLKEGGRAGWLLAQGLMFLGAVWGQLLSLAIVCLIFGIGSGGRFLSPDNIHAIVGLAGVPALLCLGVHQIVVMGGMDLSLEGVVAICGVVCGLLLKNNVNSMDVGFWILPIVVALGGAVGLLSGIIHTKLKMPSFIATLGVQWVFFGFAILISGGRSIPIQDARFQRLVTGSHILGIPNLALVGVFFWLVFEIFQSRTKTGIAMYAIGGDETLARQAGINVNRVKVIVFAICGVMYGIAALFLVTRLNSAAARVGNLLLFPAMTAAAVGGVSLTGGLGRARNAVLGTVIISALNNGMVMMRVNPYLQEAVNGIVLITAVALTIDRKKLGFIK
ncbi:MAG: ABC transporter permease [Planctomycetota bacterium]|jgi:ribose transport system permease protein|nr:ABC transporter permease [Planctomycetota bacterium]